ncbi:MAG: N-6 DNA methylase [Chitinophagaceae bacterium]
MEKYMSSNRDKIIDYISGQEIVATPEEIEATQVFSKILVEEYGYLKDHIQTRPQFRVKGHPSDTKKSYPVDIVVFSSDIKTDDNAYIIIECKKKTRQDGLTQLENYLSLSKAYIGVWFNGSERLFIKKILENEKIKFVEIPNIPEYGQRLEDIGHFKRQDLKVPHNLKMIFTAIKNHLAGNFTGATRDEELARELINLIFCKIYDEKFTKPSDIVEFRYGINEKKKDVYARVLGIFEKVKTKYSAIIDNNDSIKLDENALCYIVGELQNYCLINSQRDVIAEAFETFIGYALKGAQGQFFTPRNVVKLMVDIINPQPEELVIDPACGSGGFLVESLKHMWDILDKRQQEYQWSDLALTEEKTATAINCIRGIEKDNFLSKVAKAYMAIVGDGKGGIFCEDSLEQPKQWKAKTHQNIELGKFDVLLTNPPFGKDIKVVGDEKLKQYTLAKGHNNNAPQVLFIERSLQLLKDGGRMGIILPETFFHAPRSKAVMDFIREKNNITWLIDLPHNTFRPHNNAKCVILILKKNVKQQDIINMAVAEEIGHNHQGKEIYRWDIETLSTNKELLWDDIPLILEELKNHNSQNKSKYIFNVKSKECNDKNIFVPRFYWDSKIEQIKDKATINNQTLVSLQTLIDEKVISFFDGHGSPPAEYKGKGEYPYIRVKDIVNWEIYKDPTAKIPETIYKTTRGTNKTLYKEDIVYVRRGSYRIGSVAMVSPYDTEVLLTREILVIRVKKLNNKYGITPYYLLYLLSHKLVSEQSFNKILIETTLPNIADRWKTLMLPIDNDEKERQRISDKIANVIKYKWSAVKNLDDLQKELGNLIT